MVAVPALAQKQSPSERVKEGVDEIITILSDPEMTHPDHHDEAISVLRETAEKYISFRWAVMYSIGKPWLKMSKEMQDNLVDAFTELLERTYLQKIPSYGGENVEYKKEIISGKKAKVFTEIAAKDKVYSIEFRLKIVKGQWMIYDTIAEGVSLVGNYRSQFTKILSEGSPEDLLKMIKERTAQITEEQNKEQETQS